MDRSPRGPLRPEPSLCPLRVGNGHGGGHGGRGLHTVLVHRRVPPRGLVRALLRRAGVGSPVGRNPRGSRRLGVLGRAVCRSSRIPPPPPASRSLLGEGGCPLGSGGAEGRSCGPQAWGGGRRGGGWWGGRSPAPRPPAPSGVGLPSVISGAPPPRGILVPWGVPRPLCPLPPGSAASSGGVRGRRLFGLPPSAPGPEGEGGGGVGGALWSPGASL